MTIPRRWRISAAHLVECGAASFTRPGETDCGDRCCVKRFPGGVLAAVVDGLGHGREAAVAARFAVETLESRPADDLVSLVQRCHERLRMTRGAVMSVASFDAAARRMSWLGIGNVVGVLLQNGPTPPRREFLVLRSGMLGDQVPAGLEASPMLIGPNDVLVLATDGIRREFAETVTADQPSQDIADHILAEHGRKTDDAQVLVMRFLEAGNGQRRG